MIITTASKHMIDTDTRVVTSASGKIIGKAVTGTTNRDGARLKTPGVDRVLWVVTTEGKSALLGFATADADDYDAECRARYKAEAAAQLETPKGLRASLVSAVESAQDRLDGAWASESGDLGTGHADLATAERALAAFDAAHPGLVADLDAAIDRRVRAQRGSYQD